MISTKNDRPGNNSHISPGDSTHTPRILKQTNPIYADEPADFRLPKASHLAPEIRRPEILRSDRGPSELCPPRGLTPLPRTTPSPPVAILASHTKESENWQNNPRLNSQIFKDTASETNPPQSGIPLMDLCTDSTLPIRRNENLRDPPISHSKEAKPIKLLGKRDTILVLITNQVGIGILSLPETLKTLGLVPGVFTILSVAGLTTYTAYILLQFFREHPDIRNIADVGRKISGNWGELVVGGTFLINLCLVSASAILTISIALNTISDHASCTVLFVGLATVICWALCIPRSLSFVANIGIPSTISIVGAVMIVVIAIGLKGPQVPKDIASGWTKDVALVGRPTLYQAINAFLNIAFAFAGNQGFITVMAEMKNPAKDFMPALFTLQAFSVTIYVLVAVLIYIFAGQYISSPALGSAPVMAAKIAYGVSLPCLLGTGLVFGHTAIKYLYRLKLRHTIHRGRMAAEASGVPYSEPDTFAKPTWTAWLVFGTAFWVMAFTIANSIPVFQPILSVISALFVSIFSFILPAAVWMLLNSERRLDKSLIVARAVPVRSRKKRALRVLNVLLLCFGIAVLVGGMVAAMSGLKEFYRSQKTQVKGPWTCANNGLTFPSSNSTTTTTTTSSDLTSS